MGARVRTDRSGVLRDFELSMRRRYLSAGTIRARMSIVRRFLAYHVGPWDQAEPEDIERWLDTLPLGATARYAAISHLVQFYNWACRAGHCSRNPAALIDRPRLPRRLPRPARIDLVAVAIDNAAPEMQRILSLMADGGLRCCEVARLDWSDVDFVAGVLRFTGKGGADRVVGIPARMQRILAASNDIEGPVIGRRITPCRVSQLANAYLRRAGVGATAHQLRHLYGTRMLRATHGNLLAVQQSLGHASVTSTQIYAQVDPSTALDAARAL